MFSTSPQLATIVVLFSVSLFTACVGPAMMNRGTKYLNEGQYDMAISDFTIALQKDPNDAAIWNLRGVAYYKKAQFDKAISDFSRAIKLEQNNVLFLTNRADAYRKAGRLDDGWKDVDLALRLDPQNENLQALLSSILQVPPLDRPPITHATEYSGGWLGVSVQPMTPELAKAMLLPEAKGALISQVFDASPAFQAGLIPEDVILEVNRTPVSGPKELTALIGTNTPGSNVPIKIWRNGAPFYVSAILRGRPSDAQRTPAPSLSPLPAEGKPQETAEESKSEEAFNKEPEATPAPSLVLHWISIKPLQVPAGENFTVEVEFTVADSAVKAEQVPVKFSFAILTGSKIIHEEKPVKIDSYNGSTTRRIKKMSTGTTRKGVYKIQVSLEYKDMTKKDSMDLTIR